MFLQRIGIRQQTDSLTLFAASMRFAGIAAAFNQRCFELQFAVAADSVRDWAHLVSVTRQAVEEIFHESLPGGPASPLGGRRALANRRSRPVVINFPDRRGPAA